MCTRKRVCRCEQTHGCFCLLEKWVQNIQFTERTNKLMWKIKSEKKKVTKKMLTQNAQYYSMDANVTVLFFCQCHEIPGFCVTEFITRMNFAVHLFGKFFYLLSIRKHSIWLSFSRFPFEIGYCSNVFRSLPFNFWHFTFCAFEYLMEHFPKQKRKKLK